MDLKDDQIFALEVREENLLFGRFAQAGELINVGVLKQLEQGRRLTREDVVIRGLQEAVLHLESLVEANRFGRGIHEDRFLEQLQQHFVEPRQVHDRAVIALHQLLDRQRVGCVLVTEQRRQLRLVIEEQTILATPRQHV